MSGGLQWVEEAWDNVTTRYRVRDGLHDSKTPFQAMQFVDTYHYGKMLLLDGMVQTTEKDEFIYHEMMTHVPLLVHPDPKRVLIIGGGDGGILREALRHPSVERVVMVEIDQGVVDFSRQYLPTINDGAFDDPRAEIIIDDGAKYLAGDGESFDVVIVDSPDPIGPATVLFSKEFYGNVVRRLTPNGVMSRQTGSTFMQPEEQRESCKLLATLFSHVALYVFAVPTYIGGFFSSVLCSRECDPLAVSRKDLEARFAAFKSTARYYTPGVHLGAFELPGYVKENLNAE